jgi:Asp-tRNA(Asn)/Glu-tRNA(Gln) amidotransferase B subunit
VNSFSGIERALELEIERQRRVLDAGGRVEQQTLLWDDHRGQVRPMRSKEESHDYRYFPDPDLPPLRIAPARSTTPGPRSPSSLVHAVPASSPSTGCRRTTPAS